MNKNNWLGWLFILLQVLGYVGCFLPNNSVPTDNIIEFIGFNIIGIVGVVTIIKNFFSKKKQKNNISNSINYKNLFIISTLGLTVGLIISTAYNIYQSKQYNDCKSESNKYINLYNEEQAKNTSLINKSQFIDEHIVFVISDFKNKYVSYNCMKYLTKGTEYSFLAYNIKQAISEGYEQYKCSILVELGREYLLKDTNV